MNQNTTQQHTTRHNTRRLANSAPSLFDRSPQDAFLVHYWSCTGCGTVHVRILPEECVNCGATALEFKYAALSE